MESNMDGNASELIRLLGQLSLSEDRHKLLQDLKDTVITLAALQIQNLPNDVELHVFEELHGLFQSVNSSDSHQVELTVEVLKYLLPMIGARAVLERFKDNILQGFLHPNEDVRLLVLNQISLCIKDDDGLLLLLSSPPLCLAIVQSLSDRSLAPVKVATQILLKIAGRSDGLNILFCSDSISVFSQVMEGSDSGRFNVYDLLVNICQLNDVALGVVSNSGLLERLVEEVTNGDILVQLNALELLTPLALNPKGLTLLDGGGVIAKFQYLLSISESDPVAAMLLPDYSSVLLTVLHIASGNSSQAEVTTQLVAVETVSHIGSSVEGKVLLARLKSEMADMLESVSSRLDSGPTELKSRFVEALAQLFYLEIDNQSEELSSVMEIWWSNLSRFNLQRLTSMAKQPFSDANIGALALLNSVANQPWGQRLIANEPGLVEFLMDRSWARDKSSLEAKFAVVMTLVQHYASPEFFSERQMHLLKEHHQQGPFFVVAQAAVAMEGD